MKFMCIECGSAREYNDPNKKDDTSATVGAAYCWNCHKVTIIKYIHEKKEAK